MSEAPAVLVLTSSNCDVGVVTPVLAALEAVGTRLRAFDASRLGVDGGGAVEWVMRALTSEVAERKLEREIDSLRPDVVVGFEAGACAAACELRKSSLRPFAVLAVVSELSPVSLWANCQADRFFVVDDEAAVALEDHGVPGNSIVVVGSFAEWRFAEAGSRGRQSVKEKFGLAGKIVLVEVAGLGHEASSQLALQLSLVETEATYLFDAGNDSDAATAIRAQVPVLGIKGKLFGVTEDAPLLWRAADVVIARPKASSCHRCLAVGARMVCFQPRDGAESRRAEAIEERAWGVAAANALMIGGALDRMLASRGGDAVAGLDGAAIVADAAWIVGRAREEVVGERLESARHARQNDVDDASAYAEWAAKAATPAGGLEDLGRAGPAPKAPDVTKVARLKKEIRERKAQVARTLGDAQKQAASWDTKRAQADKLGNKDMARTSERNADLERARMHKALAEMAELEKEEAALKAASEAAAHAPPPSPSAGASHRSAGGTSVHDEAPPRPKVKRTSVEEELERLRQQASSSGASRQSKRSSSKQRTSATSSKPKSAVDDELAALKRKMAQKRKP